MGERDFPARFRCKKSRGDEASRRGGGCPGRFRWDSLWESLLKGRYLQ
jgi:hypothetical protein